MRRVSCFGCGRSAQPKQDRKVRQACSPSRLLLAIVLSALLMSTAHTDSAINIGSRLELLVDEFLIERMDGVELKLHQPVVREDVFEFDAPWEGPNSAYVTVFKDEDRYRMYYRGTKDGEHEAVCTAESPDGISWTRPLVGLHEFEGSKDNNIIWVGQGAQDFAPFLDSNPNVKPEERYKAVGQYRVGGEKSNKWLSAFSSPDGYNWKHLGTIIKDGAFDSLNVAFWDSERKEYVCYLRDRRKGVRDIRRATSNDFINWSQPQWLSYADAASEHLYTNAITSYAPHIYLGFPKRFMPERKAIQNHPTSGVSDGVFMSSRDGLNFHRWPEAFMRPGLEPENWTDRSNMAAWGILELHPGELSLYYSRHYRHPSAHMVRAALRTDGFVSASAGAEGGELLTRPLTFEGRELVINYSTSAAGEVQVEIRDEEGNHITGFRSEDCIAIYGDEIERVVKWDSGRDVSALAGKPVRLNFRLKDADLYSFRFR